MFYFGKNGKHVCVIVNIVDCVPVWLVDHSPIRWQRPFFRFAALLDEMGNGANIRPLMAASSIRWPMIQPGQALTDKNSKHVQILAKYHLFFTHLHLLSIFYLWSLVWPMVWVDCWVREAAALKVKMRIKKLASSCGTLVCAQVVIQLDDTDGETIACIGIIIARNQPHILQRTRSDKLG